MFSTLIQEVFASAHHVAVFGHDNPDGDALGSLLGLGKLLENMGKKVYYFTSPAPSPLFSFVPGIQKVKSSFDYKNKYDLIVFVDFSGYSRCMFTAGQYDYFDNKKIIVIDHHLGDCPAHALVCKDSDADSNCEWIYENTKTIRSDYYDAEVATCLYLGLATDTGNFQYDKQGSRSLENAVGLVKLGANKQLISKKIFGTVKIAQLQLLAMVMSRFCNEHGIGSLWYSYKDFEKYGLDREEAAGYLTGIVSKIEGLRFACIIKIEVDCCKVSFRSQDASISAENVARYFGGGGHFYASGAKILKDISQEKSDEILACEIMDQVKKIINKKTP